MLHTPRYPSPFFPPVHGGICQVRHNCRSGSFGRVRPSRCARAGPRSSRVPSGDLRPPDRLRRRGRLASLRRRETKEYPRGSNRNAPRSFTDHFGERYTNLAGHLAEAVPRFTPGFVDVRPLLGAGYDGKAPRELSAAIRLVFFVLKHGRSGIANVKARLLELMGKVSDAELQEDVAWYVFLTGEVELRHTMIEYAREREMRTVKEAIVTAAEKLIEEGREEGIEKGIEKGREQGKELGEQSGRLKEKREMLTRLMDRRFGLTAEERQLIAAQTDMERLDAAIDAFATADRKSEVLKHLAPPAA